MSKTIFVRTLSVLFLSGLTMPGLAQSPVDLPALVLERDQITVSGISSGAYMAVQFGTAHSSAVRGVAATAGGPYFCAGRDSWAGAAVSRVIARCMQGDPDYPVRPISAADLDTMTAATRAWSARGLIDDVAHLATQRIWLFHGYNDGIVKRPVGDALQAWYAAFVPAEQVFYKNELRAAHAQISASCPLEQGSSCNPCSTTGSNFINVCTDGPAPAPVYDAAGAALQFFYGPLTRTVGALSGQMLEYDQTPYVQRAGKPLTPIRASMADRGYVYVPAACAAGEPCRLHIAFHGCQQQAGRVGRAFVDHAGFNEWADGNRIVVLYPQAEATVAVPITPFNPQGCWDWWGYNDYAFDMTGRYATRDGLQIAAVWRMVERLAGGGEGRVQAGAPVLQARLIDRSATQAALAWTPVDGAQGYRVYRADAGGTPVLRATVEGYSWADGALMPQTRYRYEVHTIDAQGREGAAVALELETAAAAPECDPYFSLAKDTVVDARGRPTSQVCP